MVLILFVLPLRVCKPNGAYLITYGDFYITHYYFHYTLLFHFSVCYCLIKCLIMLAKRIKNGNGEELV